MKFVLSLLINICNFTTHGPRDDRRPTEWLLSQVIQRKHIEITCGTCSIMSDEFLEAAGVRSRCVTTLTLDKWNSDDNGHTLIEVLVNGAWAVVDIDQKCYITDHRGKLVNLRQICAMVQSGKPYHIVPIGKHKVDAEKMRSWYKRVLQVPMVMEKRGKAWVIWFTDCADNKRVASYRHNYKHMPRAEFMKLFYSKEPKR